MLTTISMIAALIMLAGVVVAKILTMELLAAHHRRFARLQEQLEVLRSDLRVETRKHATAERERRTWEHKRHRINIKSAHALEQIGLFEFDDSCRAAHFDLLTSHVVDR